MRAQRQLGFGVAVVVIVAIVEFVEMSTRGSRTKIAFELIVLFFVIIIFFGLILFVVVV